MLESGIFLAGLKTMGHIHSQIFLYYTSAKLMDARRTVRPAGFPCYRVWLATTLSFIRWWTKLILGMPSLGTYIMFWAPWSSGNLLVMLNGPSLTHLLHHCHSLFSWFSPSPALAEVISSSACSSWPSVLSGLLSLCGLSSRRRGTGALIRVAFDSWLSLWQIPAYASSS